jgi:hypothetical protein
MLELGNYITIYGDLIVENFFDLLNHIAILITIYSFMTEFIEEKKKNSFLQLSNRKSVKRYKHDISNC